MSDLTSRIKECGAKYQEYLIEMRRYFHQHPELSLKEVETGRKIMEELESFGIPCRHVGTPCSNGLVGTIEGGKPGKTIMLRSDMDALPIVEETGDSFASVNKGVMHACGHDCHIAILLTAAAIAMNLQSIVSREIDTQEPSVLTIGHMESGSAFNIVPAEGYMEGTTRTFSRAVDDAWADMIQRVAENTAAAYRAKAECKYTYLLGPVVNDEEMTELVRGAVRKIGGENMLGHMKPTPVAEDFSEYQKRIPGVMAFVGVGNADCDAVHPQHSCHYKVDETALLNGALLYAQVAADYLS